MKADVQMHQATVAALKRLPAETAKGQKLKL
jgi:hypothetical protein